jgi:hypothetical protein
METHKDNRNPNPDLLREDLLWGAPKKSDAEFLVSLRGKISHPSTGIWLTSRKLSLAVGLAVVLLVGVWYPAQVQNVQLADQSTSIDESVDEFVYEDADPSDLADYLGVDADFEDEDTVVQEDEFLVASLSTSELLELDQTDLDVVLDELEKTEFF